MSYTPTTWATGDVITAEKLNNMEDGIVRAGRTLMVTATGNPRTGLTLNKTLGEIKEAVLGGVFVCVNMIRTQGGTTVSAQELPASYNFMEGGGGVITVGNNDLSALTDNDYPTYTPT